MLGKLIKYDIKSMNRFLIVIHAFLLILTLLIRIFVSGPLFSNESYLDTPQFGCAVGILIALYIILMVAAYFATYLIVAIRFYKHLFSDQGYLTHTLPVTKGQHLLAKTISGSLWGIIDMLLIFLSLFIIFATPEVVQIFRENAAELRTALGFTGANGNISLGMVLAALALFTLLGIISSVIMLYASVAIGQMASGHRVLGAVVSYFVMTTLLSIVTTIVMTGTGLFTPIIYDYESFNVVTYTADCFKLTGILSVIVSVILYLITYWIMEKKVNLE